jgi:hypothetical protein
MSTLETVLKNLDDYYDVLQNKIDLIYYTKERELTRSIDNCENEMKILEEPDYNKKLIELKEKKKLFEEKEKEWKELHLQMIDKIDEIIQNNKNKLESIKNNENKIDKSIQNNHEIYDIDSFKSSNLEHHCMFIPNEKLFHEYAVENKIGLLVTSDWYMTENHIRFIRFAFENRHKKFILVECDKVYFTVIIYV